MTHPLLSILRSHPRRTARVTALLVLAGAAEGVGVLTLLPLLELAVPGGGGQTRVGRAAAAALGLVGLRPSLASLGALILLALSLKAALRWLAMAQVGAAVAGVAAELRLRLIEALLRARWSHFASQPVGRAASALSRDAYWAAFAYRDACATLAEAIQLAVYAVAVVVVSGGVGLMMLLGGLAASAPLGAWVRVGRSAGADQTRHSRALVARVVDVLQALKPIRAMGREREYLLELAAETRGLRAAEERHVRATEALRVLQEPLLALLVLGALVAALTWGGQSLSGVLVTALLFQRMVSRFHAVQSEYQAMAAAESACAALEEQIRAAERERAPDGGGAPLPASEEPPAIEVEGVRFRHEGRTVLEDVCLTVPAGSFVAVVGGSGSGKSTLLDLLAGLREPDSGKVRVDGVPLALLDRAAWHAQLGYVPQESALLHESVLANLLLRRPNVEVREAARALSVAGAAGLPDLLPRGLHSTVGERGLRLSGGERRRLALARALLGRPRVLLLDEPTAELDPRSAADVGRALRSLRGGATIVVVTHHPELAAEADVVYSLEEGRLRLAGTRASVPA
jgi:ATP-binding cassette subfamily C protein